MDFTVFVCGDVFISVIFMFLERDQCLRASLVCVCLERQVASAFYVMRILEGSAVFTFREIKTCDLQTLPRLCFESERDKKERLTSISLLDVCFVSSCRIAEFSFFCPMDICAQWQRLFHVFSWRAFCVSGV